MVFDCYIGNEDFKNVKVYNGVYLDFFKLCLMWVLVFEIYFEVCIVSC